jgi:hypothetical protein
LDKITRGYKSCKKGRQLARQLTPEPGGRFKVYRRHGSTGGHLRDQEYVSHIVIQRRQRLGFIRFIVEIEAYVPTWFAAQF